jgi:predicted HNH restriction endonuclease
MASAHERSTPSTRHLCDMLVRSLGAELPGVRSHAAGNWCVIGKPGFGYISHQRDGLTVFLRCRETDGDHLASLIKPADTLALKKREKLETAWARSTPFSFKLRRREDVIAAAALLAAVARSPSRAARRDVFLLPSEDHAAEETFEGTQATIYVNRYERDPKARRACISVYGPICAVCGFDFGKTYGDIGIGFIHVHHLHPLSAVGKKHKVNPRLDLRPVCPNCHEMLHRRSPPFSIEELRSLMSDGQ